VTDQDLMATVTSSIETKGFIELRSGDFAALSTEQAMGLLKQYGTRYLLMLPEHEVQFFQWLREFDATVWNDMWADSEVPYLVSLAYLESLSGPNANGVFPICDLQSVDNYYFSPLTFVEKESEAYTSAVRDRFASHLPLTTAQALALEASVAPIDAWHFAYRYGIKDIEVVKLAVDSLVEDRVMIHVPKAEHLLQLFEVG